MSTNIDTNIVEMRFDNKNFESNTADTINSLNRLKEGLSFRGIESGFQNITRAAGNVSFGAMTNGLQIVQLKFSALQVMAASALKNITDSVLNTGKRLVSSLTIDPIKTGFQEYETQMGAIQTILSNTQGRMKQVNDTATNGIKTSAKQMEAAAKASAKASLEALRDAQSEKLESIKDANEAERKALQKNYDDQYDAYKESIENKNDLLEEEHDARMDKYEEEYDALKESLDKENELLRREHDARLDLYEEEYMAKLKVIDEDRYNQIKAIDDQINGIKELTKAENKAAKEKERNNKLAELEKNVTDAVDDGEKLKAEQELQKYREKVNREILLEQRDAMVEELNAKKASINEQFDVEVENLKKIYEEKKEMERQAYELESEQRKISQEEQLKAIRERSELEKKTYEQDRKSRQKEQATALKNMREKYEAEREAMSSRQEMAERALRKQQKNELDVVKEQTEAAAGAIAEIKQEWKEGSTLQDVNKALDELNLYADKTIYNFTQMTRNIGTFTAAGIDLDTSVSAIKGIANLAAVSGSTSQQASTAMYQLSQALSSGTVRLMDWNSVVNAGMGGQVFQDALKETARVQGVAIDEIIAKQGSFRESLQEGWLSADILTKTLAKFTGDLTEAQLKEQGYTDDQVKKIMELGVMANDAATKVKTLTQLMDTLKEAAQSGWSQTWRLIVGDFEEAKALFTEVSDVIGGMIGNMSDARNNLLSGGLESGWKQLLGKGIIGETEYLDELKKVSKDAGVSLDDLIKKEGSLDKALKTGKISGDMLAKAISNLTTKTNNLSGAEIDKLGYTKEQIDSLNELNEAVQNGSISMDEYAEKMSKMSGRENLIEAIANAFRALVAVITPIKDAFNEIFPPATGKQLYDLTVKIKEFSTKLAPTEKLLQNIKSTAKGVFAGLSILKNLFVAIVKAIFPLTTHLKGLAGSILETTAKWGEWMVGLDTTIKNTDLFGKAIKKLTDFFGPLVHNIGVVSSDLVDKLGGAIKKVVAFFRPLIDNLLEVADTMANRLKLPEFLTKKFSKDKNGLANEIKAIGDETDTASTKVNIFSKLLSIFSGLLSTLKTKAAGVTKAIKDFISSASEKFSTPGFDAFNNIVDTIKDKLSGIGAAISEKSSGIADGIKKALAEVFNKVKEMDMKDFFAVFTLASLTGLISGIKTYFKNLSSITDELKGFLSSIKGVFESIKNMFNNVSKVLDSVRESLELYQTNIKVEILKSISVAVAILAAAIFVLSSIDPAKLAAALGAVTVLFGELLGSLKLFSKISTDVVGTSKAIGAMFGLGTAVLLLAVALKSLAKLKWDELAVGVIGVGAMMGMLVHLTNVMGKNNPVMTKCVGQIILFAVAVQKLSKAVTELAGLSWSGLAKGLLGVGTIIGGLGLFLSTVKVDKTQVSKIVSIGFSTLILAAAVKILAGAVMDMADLKWEELIKGLIGVGSILAGIAIFAKNLKDVSGGNLIGIGVAMIVIGGAMKIFVSAISDLGSMPWNELIKGLAGMGGVLAGLVIALRALPNGSDMIGIGAGIFIVSGALKILVSTIEDTMGISWTDLAKGLVAIGASMAILVVGLNAMKGSIAGAAALVVAAAALNLFVPAIKAFELISWDAIIKALVGLGSALAVFAVASLIVSPVGILAIGAAFALVGVGALAFGTALSFIGVGLISLSAGIEAFVGTVPKIAEALKQTVITLCEVVIEGAPKMGEAFKALIYEGLKALGDSSVIIVDTVLKIVIDLCNSLANNVGPLVDSVMSFLINLIGAISARLPELVAVVADVILALINGVAQVMSQIDIQSMVIGLAGIGIMTGLMYAMAGLAGIAGPAMLGALAMAAVIAELGLLFAAIGGLNQIPGLTWLIDEGAVFMDSVGKALGSLIGGFVGETMSGITEQLPTVGENLALFMTNIKPFLDGASGIDATVADGVAALAGAILAITAANVLEGLTSWLTGGSSLGKFGEDLAAFGPKFKEYSDSIAGIDAAVVSESATAAKALAEMASSLPNSGGLAGWFFGENDMDTFGEKLVPFGKALKAYSIAVDGIKAKAIEDSTIAATSISELASNLPNSGGLAGWFFGENDMDMFGKQLIPFGYALKKYSMAVDGLKTEAITESTTAAKALSELATNLPNTGGLAGWFFGDNDMASFGVQVAAFGASLKEYTDNVSGIKPEAVAASTNAAQALAELANNLPNTGGIVSWFTGDNSLESFGKSLVSFGESFAKYAEKIGYVNTQNTTGVIQEVSQLLEITKGMQGMDLNVITEFTKSLNSAGISGINGFVGAFTDSSSKVKESATGMLKTFSQGIEENKNDLVDRFKILVETLIKKITDKERDFKTAGQEIMIKFIAGMKDKHKESVDALVQILEAIKEAARIRYVGFKDVGGAIISNFVQGMNEQMGNTNPMTSIIDNLINALKRTEPGTAYNKFYEAGSFMIQGFVKGMESQEKAAKEAAEKIANTAAGAAATALDEHSPSKVGFGIGAYFGEGFVNGINDYAPVAYNSAADVAESAKNGMQQAISSIRNFIDSDIELNPTITPILDLSGVEQGSRRMNAIFSRNSAVSINSNMSGSGSIGTETSTGEASYSFVQNNYSPKALSRIEIYRQTKNQFAAMKGLVSKS